MRKTRLTALFAVLLLAVVSVVVIGCGGGSDSTTGGGGSETSGGGGGEPLTVGSDIPYPPFEQGKSGSYTGFDVELMEAIGEKIGRYAGIPGHLVRNDLPRRRPGQVRSGDLGRDDHART